MMIVTFRSHFGSMAASRGRAPAAKVAGAAMPASRSGQPRSLAAHVRAVKGGRALLTAEAVAGHARRTEAESRAAGSAAPSRQRHAVPSAPGGPGAEGPGDDQWSFAEAVSLAFAAAKHRAGVRRRRGRRRGGRRGGRRVGRGGRRGVGRV
jgi:hypothetical protein